MLSLFKQNKSLLDSFFDDFDYKSVSRTNMQTDIKENDKEYAFSVELPGFKKRRRKSFYEQRLSNH